MFEALPIELTRSVLSYLNAAELLNFGFTAKKNAPVAEEIAGLNVRTLTSLFTDLLPQNSSNWKRTLFQLTRQVILHAGGGSDYNEELCFDITTRKFCDGFQRLQHPELLFRLVCFKGAILAFNSRINSSIQRYDTQTREWTEFPCDLPKRLRGVATAVIDNALYVIGGYDRDQMRETGGVHVLEGRDMKSCSWRQLSTPLLTPRSGHSAVVYRGKIIVAGGRPMNDGDNLNTTECFDPSTQSWEPMPPMVKARYLLTLLVVEDCLYAVGGCSVGSIERFDTLANKWEHVTRIRNKRMHSSVVSVGPLIYFFGGVDEAYGFVETWDCYNTSQCSWESDSLVGRERAMPWDKFTYGQSIMMPPAPLTWK